MSFFTRNWAAETVKRFGQMVVGPRLFDFPLLLYFRHLTLRMMFPIGRKILVGSGNMFIQAHGYSGGRLAFGDSVKLHHSIEIEYSGDVTVGNDVWISQGVLIETHDHRYSEGMRKDDWTITRSPLMIEDGAWIGARALILESCCRIGANAIVAAGAVVTKDVEPMTVVAGVPAKVIRRLDAGDIENRPDRQPPD